jgi:hypothetical protein
LASAVLLKVPAFSHFLSFFLAVRPASCSFTWHHISNTFPQDKRTSNGSEGNIGSEWWQESIDMMPSSARPSLVVCSPRHLNIASKRDTKSSIYYQFIMVNG